MTIVAPLHDTVSNPNSNVSAAKVERCKLLSAVAFGGPASSFFERAASVEAAESASPVAPPIGVFDVNETLLDIEFLLPLFSDSKVVRLVTGTRAGCLRLRKAGRQVYPATKTFFSNEARLSESPPRAFKVAHLSLTDSNCDASRRLWNGLIHRSLLRPRTAGGEGRR